MHGEREAESHGERLVERRQPEARHHEAAHQRAHRQPGSTHVAKAASRSTVLPDRSRAASTGPVVARSARAITMAIAAG